jgi:hypothetical protein
MAEEARPRTPDTVTAPLPPWTPREPEEEVWYKRMQELEGDREFKEEEEAWRKLAIKMEEEQVTEQVAEAVVRLAAARITAASKAAVARAAGARAAGASSDKGGGGRRRRNSKSKKGNSGLAHVKATKTRRTRVRLSSRF